MDDRHTQHQTVGGNHAHAVDCVPGCDVARVHRVSDGATAMAYFDLALAELDDPPEGKQDPRHHGHRGPIRHRLEGIVMEHDYMGRADGPPIADFQEITVGTDPLLKRLRAGYGHKYAEA